MLSTLGKIFSRQHFEIFSYFPLEIETFCLNCLILFSGKNNIIMSICRLLKILLSIKSVSVLFLARQECCQAINSPKEI